MSLPGRAAPHPVRVVLFPTALLSFVSVWKAAALAIAELGVAVWFVAGITATAVGGSAPWFVLAAALVGIFVRAVDIESWAAFLPGGLVGRAERAFGVPTARMAAAAVLAERLLLAALAAMVMGHYATMFAAPTLAGRRLVSMMTSEDLFTLAAVIVVGLLWLRARSGRNVHSDTIAKGIWIGIAFLLALVAWALISALRTPWMAHLRSPVPLFVSTGHPVTDRLLSWLTAFALALPVIGGGSALARAAHDFAPPRIQSLRRTALLVVLFSLATVLLTLTFVVLVPVSDMDVWLDAPLTGLVQHLAGPGWAAALMHAGVVAAALLMLAPAVQEALEDAEHTLRQLAAARALPETLSAPHPRLGTLARAIDVSAAAIVLIVVASSGRVEWLARAYTFALVVTLLVKIATVIRLRRSGPEDAPFTAPGNVRLGRRALPLGLYLAAALLASAAAATLIAADVPAFAAAGLLLGLVVLFTISSRRASQGATADDVDVLELLPAGDLPFAEVTARPGNVLVPVRHPHSLSHVAAALQVSGDRDVVVMTVRLLGLDVDEHESAQTHVTAAERELFSRVVALTERHGRPVQLLIVPAHDVFKAIATTAIRLRSQEIYVGESATLSADDQARLLGEAWEAAAKPDGVQARLVIHHHSGRTDAYHLGAHPPSLTPGDLDLIHRLWLDAVKSVGPHVHHHDIVRAALTTMAEQLSGPQREDAIAEIRHVARPADELAAAVRNRDFSRLRDMVRNRYAGDIAALLTELTVEDQVVVFRLIPRKDAAAAFEYLSREAQERLLRAMAQEDVAALLNNMAPDDRTMFLEELPAAATRQLLALLTPAERSVAVSLLGYREHSIGRMMTPDYVAVREHWTIREVLDYVRSHGQDSETLNVIYVIDENGMLIDDIRIREILLARVDAHVSDLMDRRFVALKATDDQETAVKTFRQYDRTALPVTDTAGMLIGIVTIDDILDVAEQTATEDIQRIGGSEAFDEPYMKIAFWRMIKKRAGWLTALFLGEMLTATAMGAFEGEISKFVVLAVFIPLIISSGGNSGSQASTLVIRALALGEVTLRDWWRIGRREIFAGLALGSILGAIGFVRITVWSAFSTMYGEHWLLVAFTVGFALIGVVLWGTLMGSLLPLVLRKLGFDPATSSAPFVATLVDVTGLVIYFSVATVVLRGTVL